jgi:hypothetical protein
VTLGHATVPERIAYAREPSKKATEPKQWRAAQDKRIAEWRTEYKAKMGAREEARRAEWAERQREAKVTFWLEGSDKAHRGMMINGQITASCSCRGLQGTEIKDTDIEVVT